jgi:predicted Zn-dependent protease
MSRTLNLCEHLLYEGRRFWSLGVDRHALRTFSHLSRLGELPADIAEETQRRLAELYLKQRKFAKARRHLAAALSHDPNNPESHHMLACSHAEDQKGDRGLAMRHFRRCVQLDPENPRYHNDAGQFALRHGKSQQGLVWLRHAAELAPDDAEVIRDVVSSLQKCGYGTEAQCIARAAFFRNSRNPHFQRLWHDFRFQQLQAHQHRIQKRHIVRHAVAEGRICLSFQRLTVETPRGRKLVRRDGPSGPRPSHLLRSGILADQKHA